jgi:hypothetical protein
MSELPKTQREASKGSGLSGKQLVVRATTRCRAEAPKEIAIETECMPNPDPCRPA